ncbi:acyl-CoA dehydrogenase family protein [Actinomadura bangladeshensis]|uniref:Acyl-CoA dehydrogenase n=1 Tax=Actinomadura bangladeshensis TaxID=453573 RepID=A0A4R4PCK6_9ACTN|nr:acyl-CoA dehydrogenase family protein [Actinomadura bangladeshensis]TDC20361.1 acyl-CoA dehydrogenase [Actinomadura bangladeshensis]
MEDFSEEAREFRRTAREWLAANVPSEARPSDGSAMREFDIAWQRRQFEGGWAGIDWPTEYGGRGLSSLQQVIWFEELVNAGAPHKSVLAAGLNQIGHTLMLCGSDEQKKQYLPGILDGSTIWCQGFSEPEAGSDLASLRTRARVVGDELVIDGSKVWCSFGPYARMQGLLVRTGPPESRHRGLTWVVVDLQTPGVVVRPIRTIDGNAEFAEVFYDKVHVPLSNVVGEVGRGWAVALSTLALERGPAFLDTKLSVLTDLEKLRTVLARSGALQDTALGTDFAKLRAEALAVRAMAYRVVSTSGDGADQGALSFNVYCNELRQRISAFALRVLGSEAVRCDRWTLKWLNDFCATIGGGTSDIQRNVIAERVLELPR